jgi:hypothetical protein
MKIRAAFDYVTTVGHLLCAPPDGYHGRPLPTHVGPFREPFVFFAYLAAVTQRLAFRTGIEMQQAMRTHDDLTAEVVYQCQGTILSAQTMVSSVRSPAMEYRATPAARPRPSTARL